jgi:glutaredoxin
MRKGINKLIVVGVAVVALAAIAIGYKAFTGMSVATGSNYDNFAKCLTEKGVVMYGSVTCPHCQNQKKVFGESFKYISYIECSENPTQCSENGVQFVPTWSIDGKLYTGEKTIEELSSLSGCELK